ncbi:hypothetical protein C8R45DRAFT_934104 [Mycena sanguinolenta]|nr:hypothetical protein C8R45DRAFT_934104 [Mycena sanguinolenta]
MTLLGGWTATSPNSRRQRTKIWEGGQASKSSKPKEVSIPQYGRPEAGWDVSVGASGGEEEKRRRRWFLDSWHEQRGHGLEDSQVLESLEFDRERHFFLVRIAEVHGSFAKAVAMAKTLRERGELNSSNEKRWLARISASIGHEEYEYTILRRQDSDAEGSFQNGKLDVKLEWRVHKPLLSMRGCQAAARAFPAPKAHAYVALDASFSVPSWPSSDSAAPLLPLKQADAAGLHSSFGLPPVPIAYTKADDAPRQCPHARRPLPLRPERWTTSPASTRDNFLLQRRGAPTHSSRQALLRMPGELELSKLLLVNTSPAHSVPLPSSASFTLEGEEDALVPTLHNTLLYARILHVHWTTQTLLDLLPPLILLLLRIVILVFSSISTATSSPSSPMPNAPPPSLDVGAAARASGELAAAAAAVRARANRRRIMLVPAVFEHAYPSTTRARGHVPARLRLPGRGKAQREGASAVVLARGRRDVSKNEGCVKIEGFGIGTARARAPTWHGSPKYRQQHPKPLFFVHPKDDDPMSSARTSLRRRARSRSRAWPRMPSTQTSPRHKRANDGVGMGEMDETEERGREGWAEEASGRGGRVGDGRWKMEETGRKEEDEWRRIRRHRLAFRRANSLLGDLKPLLFGREKDVPRAVSPVLYAGCVYSKKDDCCINPRGPLTAGLIRCYILWMICIVILVELCRRKRRLQKDTNNIELAVVLVRERQRKRLRFGFLRPRALGRQLRLYMWMSSNGRRKPTCLQQLIIRGSREREGSRRVDPREAVAGGRGRNSGFECLSFLPPHEDAAPSQFPAERWCRKLPPTPGTNTEAKPRPSSRTRERRGRMARGAVFATNLNGIARSIKAICGKVCREWDRGGVPGRRRAEVGMGAEVGDANVEEDAGLGDGRRLSSASVATELSARRGQICIHDGLAPPDPIPEGQNDAANVNQRRVTFRVGGGPENGRELRGRVGASITSKGKCGAPLAQFKSGFSNGRAPWRVDYFQLVSSVSKLCQGLFAALGAFGDRKERMPKTPAIFEDCA